MFASFDEFDENLTPVTPRLHTATHRDEQALTALLQKSYTELLAGDYAPEVLRSVLPRITKARPALMSCKSYYVIEEEGRLLAAGGYTQQDPWAGLGSGTVGHIRHFVTDPKMVRRGFGSWIMSHALLEAKATGLRQLECYATLSAERFYASHGFETLGPIEMDLGVSHRFPAVHMRLHIEG